MATHVTVKLSVLYLVMSPYLSLGNYLGLPNVFIILCRLRLVGTTVSLSENALQLPAITELNFYTMIHAHVPMHVF